MRSLEQQYLLRIKKGKQKLENQVLIMTIQSLNKLNVTAINKNMPDIVTNKVFTEQLKGFCMEQIESSKLDHLGFAMLINQLGLIERNQRHILQGDILGKENISHDNLLMHILKHNQHKFTERIEMFTTK